MLLYHYSSEFFRTLKTRRASGIATPEQIAKAVKMAETYHLAGAYVDHISFFFDPIPSRLLGEIFGTDHKAWAKGNELFEYSVDVRTFPNKVLYTVVETPEDIRLLDAVEWQDNETFRKDYLLAEADRKVLSGETGFTLKALKLQMAKYQGHTAEYYAKNRNCDDWEDIRNMYAARVPHLMFYPPKGEVQWCGIKQLTIGSDTRRPVSPKLLTPSSAW